MTLTPPGPADTALLVEVLRAAGVTRQRAATKAALEVTAGMVGTGSDKARPAALRITRVLAEAGHLAEVADNLEAGTLVIIALDAIGLTPADVAAGDKRLAEALVDDVIAGAAERRLNLVPNPTTEETPTPVTEPRTPTEAEADRATADAEAILDARFPGETIIGEHDREPAEQPLAVAGAPIPAGATVEISTETGMVVPVVDPGPLPPGHGDDDDLSDLVDVAELAGFDADAPLDR